MSSPGPKSAILKYLKFPQHVGMKKYPLRQRNKQFRGLIFCPHLLLRVRDFLGLWIYSLVSSVPSYSFVLFLFMVLSSEILGLVSTFHYISWTLLDFLQGKSYPPVRSYYLVWFLLWQFSLKLPVYERIEHSWTWLSLETISKYSSASILVYNKIMPRIYRI